MSESSKRGRPATGTAKSSAERQKAYRERQKASALNAISPDELNILRNKIEALELELRSMTSHRDALLERVKGLESTIKRHVTENQKLKDKIKTLELQLGYK